MFVLVSLALVFFGLTALVLLKRTLFFAYLWQNREYRLDRMLDFLRLPESRLALSEKWTQIRILSLLFLNLALLVDGGLVSWATIIFWLVIAGEGLFFVFKLALKPKQVRMPRFTAKAISLFGLSSLLVIPLALYLQLLSFGVLMFNNQDMEKLVMVSAWLSLFVGLIILLIPVIMGLALVLLWPLDVYLKRRLAQAARIHRDAFRTSKKDLSSVAISGSFGKSTTKEILSKLLSANFEVAKTLGFNNTAVSTARQFLKISASTEVFISEIGSYKRGEGRQICQFIQPRYALITGLNHQHLSLFGSEENIIRGESEALEFLQPKDLVVVNWDSQMCRQIQIPDKLKLIKYSIHDRGVDYYAEIVEYDGQATTFKLTFGGKTYALKTNLFSLGNIQNLTGALALSLEMGCELSQLKPVLLELELLPATLHVLDKEYGKLLDDSHNANLDGVLNALDSLELFDLPKIVFLDDILELGAKTHQAHQQVAKKLFAAKPELVVLCGKSFPKLVRDELIENGYDENRILLATPASRNTTLELIKSRLVALGQAVVLLEGYQTRYYLNDL
jgi:UDP-N-acetylmuramoyl-tripeptide--D-alanyl-D-alanine ligase